MQRLSEYAWAARGIKAACDALQMRCAAACVRRYVNAPSGYRFAEACRPCFFTAMMFLWADHPCGIPSGGGVYVTRVPSPARLQITRKPHFAKALGYRNALCGGRGCWNGTNCTLQQWGLHGSALCGTLRKQSVGFKPPFFKGWLKPCPQSQPLVPKIQPSVVNDEGLYLVGEDGFGPRTKKQSTGLFFASSTPCCPHLIFSSQKYDPPPYRRRVILGGRGWIRTIEAK